MKSEKGFSSTWIITCNIVNYSSMYRIRLIEFKKSSAVLITYFVLQIYCASALDLSVFVFWLT